MKARPILFSSPMVRALLEGRKTQTRRIVKPQPVVSALGRWRWDFKLGGFVGSCGTHIEGFHDCASFHCPYGQPGALLWVREAHYVIGEIPGPAPGSRWTHYAADLSNNLGDTDHQWARGWKPSIHMPRWASRLTLRITDVRVQRLQDIGETDAVAEGAAPVLVPPDGGSCPHAEGFRDLWESINGPGSWDDNPWVWAISFDVLRANVDAVLAQREAA